MTINKLKSSPIEELHIKNNARLVDFAGWSMPVQFSSGIINEHISTRTSSGLFDISHMGQIAITGMDSCKLLESITPTDIKSIQPGRVRYSFILNEKGGIIDDLMITNEGESYYLVVNASRTKNDLDEIFNAAKSFKDISINHLHSKGMIALQGPKAIEVIKSYFDDINKLNFMDYKKTTYKDVEVRISRVGYTGEDGFEISTSKDLLLELTQNFLNDKRVSFCGLGARDTLRLEAGLPLYGNELSESITPIQADLGFAVSSSRVNKKDFRGAEKIINEINNGPEFSRVGLLPEGKRPVRKDTLIYKNGEKIGKVTSGGYGPSIGSPVSMGSIKSQFNKTNDHLEAQIGNNFIPLKITSFPFVPHRYHRKGKV